MTHRTGPGGTAARCTCPLKPSKNLTKDTQQRRSNHGAPGRGGTHTGRAQRPADSCAEETGLRGQATQGSESSRTGQRARGESSAQRTPAIGTQRLPVRTWGPRKVPPGRLERGAVTWQFGTCKLLTRRLRRKRPRAALKTDQTCTENSSAPNNGAKRNSSRWRTQRRGPVGQRPSI